MTDKQVKEGIDVSQCECYSVEDNSCNKTLSGSCMKEKCQTFRLLQTIQAKEQECEELKIEVEKWESAFTLDTKMLDNADCRNNELEQQLDQLKAENDKLKQTLAEIKEIAETAAKYLYATKSDDYAEGYRWLGSIILQKIRKREMENEGFYQENKADQ